MKQINVILLLLFTTLTFSQGRQDFYSLFQAKTWDEDTSLFRCKAFLFQDVLNATEHVSTFSVEPLAATKSGALTTLIYKSQDLSKEGLILGFYGGYLNDDGVNFQGYGFKNLNKQTAILFLDKIQTAMDENKKFLQSDNDNNNVFFEFDDMQILIYREGSFLVRVFWNGFDCIWENTAFKKSKKRFEKKS